MERPGERSLSVLCAHRLQTQSSVLCLLYCTCAHIRACVGDAAAHRPTSRLSPLSPSLRGQLLCAGEQQDGVRRVASQAS